MTWQNILAIALMAGADLLMWAIIRYYTQHGIIFAFPRSIERGRSPRWFSFGMAVLWISLALSVAFTIVVSSALVFGK